MCEIKKNNEKYNIFIYIIVLLIIIIMGIVLICIGVNRENIRQKYNPKIDYIKISNGCIILNKLCNKEGKNCTKYKYIYSKISNPNIVLETDININNINFKMVP